MPTGEQGEKGQERQMGQRIGGDTWKGKREGERGEGRKLTKLKGIFSKQDHRNVIDRR